MTDREFLEDLYRRVGERLKASKPSVRLSGSELEHYKRMRDQCLLRIEKYRRFLTGNDERTVLGDMW